MAELIYKEEVYLIVGAAMEVYNELGTGFLESVYQEAMEIECRRRNIPFESQRRLSIRYKELTLQKEFIADMLFFENIIVELKALERISGKEESQIINYLKATGCKMGVVINFGAKHALEWKRYVY
jgi:GxxExxY protein